MNIYKYIIVYFFVHIKMDNNKLWVILEIIFSLFMQHFLHNEPIVGIEYEAQLQKTLLPRELIYHVLLYSYVKFLDKLSSC